MKSIGLEIGNANKANPTKYNTNANGTLKLSSQGIAFFSNTVIINANRKNVTMLKVKRIIRLQDNSVEF